MFHLKFLISRKNLLRLIKIEPDDNNNLISIKASFLTDKILISIVNKLTDSANNQFIRDFKSKIEYVISNYQSITTQLEYFSFDFDPYLIFNDKLKKTLFFLPPSEGGAECYLDNIVKHLSSDFRLILFNNYLLHLKSKIKSDNATYENLASFYIRYIKRIQPSGPYNFIGWSFGGILSFEIARQLSNSDKSNKIGSIMMIDSYFNFNQVLIPSGCALDKLNYNYNPSIYNEKFYFDLPKINILLFKAFQVDEYESILNIEEMIENKRCGLFYAESEYNYLDSIVDKKFIKVSNMGEFGHVSWVYNKIQIESMCKEITDLMNKQE